MSMRRHHHHHHHDENEENMKCHEEVPEEKGCGCCNKHDDYDGDACKCEHRGRRPRGIFNRRRTIRHDED